MDYSDIPLLVHQQWSDTDITNWPDSIRQGAESWLEASISDSMAYFLWVDDGKKILLDTYEISFTKYYDSLPRDIERSDVFRALAIKRFGGIVSPATPCFSLICTDHQIRNSMPI